MAKIDRIVDGNVETIHEHEITAYCKVDDQMGSITYEIRIGDHRVTLTNHELAGMTKAFYKTSFGFIDEDDDEDE
jgi:hypothetical protein